MRSDFENPKIVLKLVEDVWPGVVCSYIERRLNGTWEQ